MEMDKRKADFIALCKEVRECSVCHNIKFTPHAENSNCFIKEQTQIDEMYVNRWNLWQNSLDADIMVIGQDYGVCEENSFVTDRILTKLFNDVFSIDIEKKNSRLFFTNIANCYRKHKSTGMINKGCLALCANKYMARLVEIVSPKVIITLGQDTFQALACCDKAKLICKNPAKGTVNNNLGTIMKFDYRLLLENKQEIPVFPVYHPGATGRMNRAYEQQTEDWKRILAFLEGAPRMGRENTDKHPVRHHNMYGPSCEVAGLNCEDDFKIYCRREHRICIPKCNGCQYFGGDEMGQGVCCIWEESSADGNGDDRVVQHDEVYIEFQRAENPAIYKKMMRILEDGDLDLCKAWQDLD